MGLAPGARPGLWRFGPFELDESSGELRRNGSLLHLPPQPLQILKLLIGNAGEIVDRDRIRREIWGQTAVDFDRSVNVAIAQIRSALNDDAASPRFIQTIPRRGYRFLGDVSSGDSEITPVGARAERRVAIGIGMGIALVAMLSGGAFRYWHVSGGPIRIAVLPFETQSLDVAESSRSDGLFDDLLTGLGGIQPNRIEVIGRRSVSGLNAHGPGTIRDVGKRLNVGYVLESSVRHEGDSLRLAARLVETGSEAIRWSGTFSQDGPPAAFSETVVGRISAGVLSTLFPGASPVRSTMACTDGADSFETGRLLVNRGGLKDLQQSLEFFGHSACGPARAESAEVLVRLSRMGRATAGSWESARASAQAALNIDRNIALAHLALGNIAFWHDWNWNAAQRELREALRINPSDPDAHHDLAWVELAVGLRGDATASLETAIAIDPLSARTRMDSAWLLLQMGQFERAASEARRALELNPGVGEARLCISRALLYAGDVRSALEVVRPLMPQSSVREIAALSPNDATRRLVEFQMADAAIDGYQRAWRLAFLGSRAEAITALEDGFEKRSLMMPLIGADPAFRTIRDEPRFRSILRRMALSF